MAIADVTIIPIGTETPSVSAYVAEIQTILEEFKKEGKIKYQLTPMNTLIEGELSDVFQVIQTIHEAPFQRGYTGWPPISELMTKRDKKTTMEGKLSSVQKHLNR
ncbi:MTH1187 family thiamine-binding protein [Bacillus sonorensis]|nr:MTH1187 family thiamine-binding protein [Bacillus sonorensis]